MFVELDGIKIKYSEYGQKQSNHILFIHGLGSSSIIWGDIPEALAKHFHTISIDLVGFGESDKPSVNYTMNYFCRFIGRFIDKIGIKNNETISLVGHSMGGQIPLEYAMRNISQVKSIILFDSTGLISNPTLLLCQYLDAVLTTNSILKTIKLKTVFENLLADPARYLPISVDIFESDINRLGGRDAFKSAFNNSISELLDLDALKKIKHIPSLLLWGEKDTLIPVDFAFRFTEMLGNRLILVNDSGHAPFVEKPAIVYQALLDFLF